MDEELERALSLAQMEDVEELKARYRCFSDQVLEKWRQAIVGPHREAMEAVLRERRESR